MELASGWFGGRPRSASAQLREAHDLGMEGVALLPGDPAVELEGIEVARRDLGRGFAAASWDALQAASHRSGSRDVASADRRRQLPSIGLLPATLERLHRLGSSILILPAGWDDDSRAREDGEALVGRLSCGQPVEAGAAAEVRDRLPQSRREAQLEALARFLHEASGQAPGVQVALCAPASPAGLLDPAGLSLLRQESSLRGLGYWHDAGAVQTRASLGLEDPGAWLEAGGGAILGASLQDCARGRDRLPPGEGEVDFRLIAEYLPGSARRVMSLAPGYPVAVVREARQALTSLGLG